MRFKQWLWVMGVVWIGVASGQTPMPPGRNVFLPKPANLTRDPPIVFLKEYANTYQALKTGGAVTTLGSSFMIAQSILSDPRRCTAPQGLGAITELSTSFQRLAGRTDPTMASNREIVLTSIARHSCADSDTDDSTPAVARVPGYEMMAVTKGTLAETIAPRKRTVLPGMSNDQAGAFQEFGDLTQRFRKDPGAASVPGSIAAGMAELEELKKLPPEERRKAVDELNARYAKQKRQPVVQANSNQMAKSIVSALSAKDAAIPRLPFLQLLKPGDAYVDLYKYYVREGDSFGPLHYLAVISDGRESRLVRLGPAEPIDTAVGGYLQNSPDRKTFESSWKALEGLLAQPLLASLPAESKMIWLSPDSDLFSVPFASLLLGLRADLSVTVVPSAYDFARLASIPAGPPTGKALLVGDLVETSAAASDVQAVALADVTSDFAGQELQVQRLSGRDATLPTVLAGMKDAQYMLFSTHGRWANGLAATTSEAFGSAGIELWSEGTGASGSVLTAADIIKIDLSHSDLVVLLACETARGQAVNGQGSLGFQSAFMAAGARSLLVALWRVPADASKELVQHFYS
jgi:hypothetical protein